MAKAARLSACVMAVAVTSANVVTNAMVAAMFTSVTVAPKRTAMHLSLNAALNAATERRTPMWTEPKTAEPHHGIPVPGCKCLGCDAMRELHETARRLVDENLSKTMRYIIKKETGSEWARVIDTSTGRQIAKYSVMPRRNSRIPNGWTRAECHAAALNQSAGHKEPVPSTYSGSIPGPRYTCAIPGCPSSHRSKWQVC